MRGTVGYKQFYPEWKGHWNFASKDNRETVNRSQTFIYKKSSKIWPFIPENEKQNYDIFSEANRRGIRDQYPAYEKYLSSHLKKYACEFCGLWEGSFCMENTRIPIKESFRLGIGYYGTVNEFDPSALPANTLRYDQYASHLLYDPPSSGLVILYGMGENEFGLFKALVCINMDTAIMTLIKCYVHDALASTGTFLTGSTCRTKGESIESIRKRLLDPANRRRKTVKTGSNGNRDER